MKQISHFPVLYIYEESLMTVLGDNFSQKHMLCLVEEVQRRS